jgi:hypothetical protein
MCSHTADSEPVSTSISNHSDYRLENLYHDVFLYFHDTNSNLSDEKVNDISENIYLSQEQEQDDVW